MTESKFSLALTVDVEDWGQSSWDRSLPLSDYCADNARRLLDIISEFPSARATFFVLGKFAEKHPGVVREIHQMGHEIGSHGWGHEEIFHLDRDEFREDLRRSTAILAEITGSRPLGYRAPDFSVVGETLWALEILSAEGYVYDSSIFPIAKARYGIETWPRDAVQVRLKTGQTITEFPLATLDIAGRRLPIGGGGYARLLPGRILRGLLRKAGAQLNCPPVFYCHPYELDGLEFGRMDIKIPFKVRLHQGMGRKQTAAKLRRLLASFDCISLGETIARFDNLPVIDCSPFVLEAGSVNRPTIF